MTLEQALTKYTLEEIPKLVSGINGQSYHLKNFKRVFGKIFLDELDDAAISKYVGIRGGEKPKGKDSFVTPSTINKELNTLNKINNLARNRWKILAGDFTISEHKPKIPKRTPFFFTKAEIDKIIAKSLPHLHEQIIFLLNTGARLQNMIMLKKRDCDMVNHTINFPDTKTGDPHTIPMTWQIYLLIKRKKIVDPDANIFTYKGNDIETSSKTALNTAIENAGVRKPPKGTLFHAFRHTAATWMLENGVDLATIQRILGHANISSTMVYAHVLEDAKKAGLSKIASQIRHNDGVK